ncbi:hypothetical protein [Burkholderia vietnamiensis]|uniref:hypothetical protein n=1 Tax=Burkholderia vietnamiensis TaxID=60552 RepID=UPI0012DA2783|nr:hypothetical protein [Burkholderia vietnamiensis]
MTIDIFAALVQPLSRIEIHNVQLLDVRPGEDGRERFVVEHQGTKHELTGGSWNETFSRRDVGRFGYVLPATARLSEHREGVCYFRPYLDQSLRRVPEFDASTAAEDQGGRAPEVVGWVCDSVIRPRMQACADVSRRTLAQFCRRFSRHSKFHLKPPGRSIR